MQKKYTILMYDNNFNLPSIFGKFDGAIRFDGRPSIGIATDDTSTMGIRTATLPVCSPLRYVFGAGMCELCTCMAGGKVR